MRKRAIGAACATLVLAILCAAPGYAAWVYDGLAISTAANSQTHPTVVSDGAGGVIITWMDSRSGSSDIYTQRVSASGAVQWTTDGVVLCMAANDQDRPAITSDGAGGAIVTWQDYRSGNWDVYAQRVSASGTVQWAADGVALSMAANAQDIPMITSDGAGGAIVTWRDYRSDNWDVYAQRVNASGTVQWAADGVALSTATGSQSAAIITSDGAGGAIVTWADGRDDYSDVYAQRVNASGSVQWKANGVAISTGTGDQRDPQITSDGAGGAIITWIDSRSGNFDVYAQRVNASGAVLWVTNGVALCTATGNQSYPPITSDGAGGGIVTWYDLRSGSTDIYAQRVNASGSVQWRANGVALCTATADQGYPNVVSDGAGGAIVTWFDGRSGNYDIYAQRVNTSGATQWTADGAPICTAAGAQMEPQLIPDGSGGAIIVWIDGRSDDDIYVQRVDASGAAQWTSDGVPICTATDAQRGPQIVSDGAGGAIITWMDNRESYYDVYASRVDASGAVQWTANGVALCARGNDQRYPAIVGDGAGGAIVAWIDWRNIEANDFIQRVDASGAVQWTTDGVALIPVMGEQSGGQIVTDGAGGAIIAWDDSRIEDGDIYCQRTDPSGVVQWAANGVPLCTATGAQFYSNLTTDGAGGAVGVWVDTRNSGDLDIYAQRINHSGAIQWIENGVPVCTAIANQNEPVAIPDGSGGTIIAWDDYRNQSTYDIYAQRLNSSGVAQWAVNGVALCSAAGERYYPDIAPDGAGGVFAAWLDYRSGYADVYAQHLNASGAAQWTASGVALCTTTDNQNEVRVAPDGSGGAIFVWTDYRDGNGMIYTQRVDVSGAAQWTADGIAVCPAGSYQYDARILPDGAGGAIITWYKYLSGTADVYAQRLDAFGVAQWAATGVVVSAAAGDQWLARSISDGTGGVIITWMDSRTGTDIFAQRVRDSGEIVGTQLQDFAAVYEGGRIRVEWSLSEMDNGARFTVLRSSAPEWRFAPLEGASIERSGFSFSFIDETCLPGSSYQYRVVCESQEAGSRVLFETERIATPAFSLTLYQNHPNPFNPRTEIRFYLPETGEITLEVFDVAGRRVATLAEGRWEKGYHTISWDGRAGSGAPCASGVYLSRLKAGKLESSRKMLLLQ